MRPALFLSACLTMLTATGCVETENAPFLPGDLVFEPGLLGDWIDDVDSEKPIEKTVRRLEIGKGGVYRCVTDVGGEKQSDDLTLFKLGDRYFVAFKGEKGYKVLRLTVSGSCVKLWEMSAGEVLGDHPGEAKHSADALTGPTAEVRTFLLKHSDDPGVWGSHPWMYRRKDGLKVTPAGLTSGKQRTLDYWAELRSTLQGVRIVAGGRGAAATATWEGADKAIRLLSTEGVDADAAACGPLAAGMCEALAEYTRKRRLPDDPLAAQVRESTGGTALDQAALPLGREAIQDRARDVLAKLEAARKKLSERYKCEFPSIR